MIRGMAAWLSLSLFVVGTAQAQTQATPLFGPSGYRMTQYRGVVPAGPEGVARIDARGVAALVAARRAILIDVVPAEGGVRDATTGRWTLAMPHVGLPGARWFPEAGRGAIDPSIERSFLAGIAALHRQAPKSSLIVFCLADCWMSWNAALRLYRTGYHDVRWFAEGADGWRDIGKPLVPQTPYDPNPK